MVDVPVSGVTLGEHKRGKQTARERLALEGYDVATRCLPNDETLKLIPIHTMGNIDRKVKHRQDLTYEEAFCGMCYVLAATNNHFFRAYHPLFEQACGEGFSREHAVAMASAFLNLMAAKETFHRLTAEEIAGMVAAGMMDCMIALEPPEVIETCGMGGDRGFGNGMKSINASTLSALVLAALGLPAVKHGSYGNTSKVGSTDCIENFGARTSMNSTAEVLGVWQKAGFCFFDAHWCKTLHDLSHLLRVETVNHVLGPMTPPLSQQTEIYKVMGVNEKVHPQTIAQAYALLHQKRKQKVGGVFVVCGLDEAGRSIDCRDYDAVRKHTVTDELSPYAAVVSAVYGDRLLGTCLVTPEDFGVKIDLAKIQVPNDAKAIKEANIAALRGSNIALANYLAMNAALGLYAYQHLGDRRVITAGLDRRLLRPAFHQCLKAITEGKVEKVLSKYVEASGGVLNLH